MFEFDSLDIIDITASKVKKILAVNKVNQLR
jgi:hypothetical protein